jgi:hypothetical protein
MIVIYSVFLTTLQNREKAKKCGLQKENGFLIVTPETCIFNSPTLILRRSAEVCLQPFSACETNFATKNNWYESNIQNSVLREQKQGEKRYCSHHGASDNQRNTSAVQLQVFHCYGAMGHQGEQSEGEKQGSP